jgi:hypothetical protein
MDAERAAGPTMGDSSPILVRDGQVTVFFGLEMWVDVNNCCCGLGKQISNVISSLIT